MSESAPTEYEHKGVAINFDVGKGEFVALVATKFRRFSSLAAARKAIDKAQTFTPFKALCHPAHSFKRDRPEFVEVEVVGVHMPTGKASWRNARKWRLADGRDVSEVWADTPENRQAFADRAAMSKRHSDVERQQRDESNAMETRFITVPFDAVTTSVGAQDKEPVK